MMIEKLITGLGLLMLMFTTAACGEKATMETQTLEPTFDESELEASAESPTPVIENTIKEESVIASDAVKKTENLESKPVSTKPLADPAAPQPLQLIDESSSSPEFSDFRENLRKAVQVRDAGFIRAIAASDIKLTFGLPMTIDDLDIDNPNAIFWKNMEKAIATGCAVEVFGIEPEQETWICPHVFIVADQVQTIDPYEQVIIVGESVNVRGEPKPDSTVIGILSNEAVRYDSDASNDFSEPQRQAMSTLDGWLPIIMPNGEKGFVSSRFGYSPLGYRAFFVPTDDEWTMTVFIAGD